MNKIILTRYNFQKISTIFEQITYKRFLFLNIRFTNENFQIGN